MQEHAQELKVSVLKEKKAGLKFYLSSPDSQKETAVLCIKNCWSSSLWYL